jgi:hypothetical protein
VLQSFSNIHRCNAAEVLLGMYPLEHHGGCVMENVTLMELQHATMNRLLMDDCHIVRIIAIRVCIQTTECLCSNQAGLLFAHQETWCGSFTFALLIGPN